MILLALFALAQGCHAISATVSISAAGSIATDSSAPQIDRSLVSLSMEDTSVPAYTASSFCANFLESIYQKTFGRPAIRIGGSSIDKTLWNPNQAAPLVYYPTASSWTSVTFGPRYFSVLPTYFTSDTEISFGINLANQSTWNDSYSNDAAQFAAAIHMYLPQLTTYEIGNEIDSYVGSGFRATEWNTALYAPQWQEVADAILELVPSARFQGAVYAGTMGDFTLPNLIGGGVSNAGGYSIPAYSMHLYPQGACASRIKWNNNDALINHLNVVKNVTHFAEQISAARGAGSQFYFGETNSVSCSGTAGISDTFSAALWMVDYVLQAASAGVTRLYFHSGATAAYSIFIPLASQGLDPGVHAIAYGWYFVAEALAIESSSSSTQYKVMALSDANTVDLSGYGLYSNNPQIVSLSSAVTETLTLSSASLSTYTMDSTYVKYTTKTLTSLKPYTTTSSVSKQITSIVTQMYTSISTVPHTTTVTTKRVTSSKTLKTTTRTSIVKTSTKAAKKSTTYTTTIKSTYTTNVPHTLTSTYTTTYKAVATAVYTTKIPTTRTTYITTVLTTTSASLRVTTIASTLTSAYVSTLTSEQTSLSATVSTVLTAETPANYLARAIILNMSVWNASTGLDCGACSIPSNASYASTVPRASSLVEFYGFQANRTLSLLRLQGPGTNAKSLVNISGLTFGNDGTIATEAMPETVTTDGNGLATFSFLQSEAVLLIDPDIF